MTTTTRITIADTNVPAEVTVEDAGEGRPFLLLHGGAGPRSVRGFAELLVGGGYGRAIVPVHPGFEGTDRPERLDSVRALAGLYCQLLADLDLHDVTVLGNSIG